MVDYTWYDLEDQSLKWKKWEKAISRDEFD